MFQQGEEGQQFNIMLRMSLVVDVCIVGFTNSGKSTLLSALSSARPEIAEYRFTTKIPVLGVVDDGVNKLTWVELPALTKDSRLGKGLGNTFLNQAVRASVIVYLLDAGSSDLKDDFDTLRNEVSAFDEKLGRKASIIVINKVDSTNSPSLEDYVKKKLEVTGLTCIMISSLDKTGLDTLVTHVHRAVKEIRGRPSDEPAAEVVFRPEPVDQREKK
jgi:GTP-binding protein